MTHSVKHLFK